MKGESMDINLDAIENINGDAVISYAMDKRPEQEWNAVFGAQFQINKRWMIRSEAGLIGDRKTFLASFNYRFKI